MCFTSRRHDDAGHYRGGYAGRTHRRRRVVRVVIAGASLAGLRTAQALRARGQRGPIALIGAETELPLPYSLDMQVVLNAFRVLEEVAELQPVGVSELARRLDLPKSSVQRALKALETAGWLRASATDPSRWALTTRAFDVGQRVVQGLEMRSEIARAMEQLRTASNETVHLVVLEGLNIVIVDRLDSPNAVRTSYPLGLAIPAIRTATGKAIIARLSLEEVDKHLQGNTNGMTWDDRSVEAFMEDLDEVRRLGYATSRDQPDNDVGSVAAAILDQNFRPIAAIGISGPIDRMPESLSPKLGQLLVAVTQRIKLG